MLNDIIRTYERERKTSQTIKRSSSSQESMPKRTILVLPNTTPYLVTKYPLCLFVSLLPPTTVLQLLDQITPTTTTGGQREREGDRERFSSKNYFLLLLT